MIVDVNGWALEFAWRGAGCLGEAEQSIDRVSTADRFYQKMARAELDRDSAGKTALHLYWNRCAALKLVPTQDRSCFPNYEAVVNEMASDLATETVDTYSHYVSPDLIDIGSVADIVESAGVDGGDNGYS